MPRFKGGFREVGNSLGGGGLIVADFFFGLWLILANTYKINHNSSKKKAKNCVVKKLDFSAAFCLHFAYKNWLWYYFFGNVCGF